VTCLWCVLPACRITYDSYNISGIGVGDYTYGLLYSKPRTVTGGLQLPAVEADPGTAGCFLYNVPAADSQNPELHLSQIADLFGLGLKLPELIQKNTARGLFEFSDEEQQLPILDVPLNGKTVQLCYNGKYIKLCSLLSVHTLLLDARGH